MYNLPRPQQAWAQAIQQQQALYRDAIAKQMAAYGYNQAPPSASVFGGLGPYSNPLFGQANPVSSTGLPLFQRTAAGNPYVQETLASAGQPGETGISSNPLLMQSMGQP